MGVEVQVVADGQLLEQFLTFYFATATLGIALSGWTTYFAPNISTELSSLVLFGKFRPKQRSTLQTWIEVPKRWFVHFYIVASICSLTGTAAVFGYLKKYDLWNDGWQSDRVRLGMALMALHSLRRLYECLFISVFSDSRMNLLHYTMGMTYYVCVPATILLAHSQPWRVTEFDAFDVAQWDALSGLVLLGLVLYLWAFVHQHKSFRILANLRKGRSNTTHSIPQGDLFRFVSSPHYLCECVLYMGLGLVVGLQGTLWLWLLVFVLNNQLLCALQAHRWYHRTFGRVYPGNRTAFLPFIL